MVSINYIQKITNSPYKNDIQFRLLGKTFRRKDLRHTEIEADTFEQAKQILEKRERWVFRVELSE